jgi:hypothetical protein
VYYFLARVVLFRNFIGTQLLKPNIEIIYIALILLQHKIGHKKQTHTFLTKEINKSKKNSLAFKSCASKPSIL